MVDKEASDLIPKFRLDRIQRGEETLLVVEDQNSVRNVVVRTLKDLGYSVYEASSGEEAYQMCSVMPESVDLVITDVIMSVMSGAELEEKLRDIWPEVRVLFMSGYSENAITRNGILDSDIPYIQKPFRPADMGLKVREVLDGELVLNNLVVNCPGCD